MPHRRRYFLTIALFALMTGCSTYHVARLPPADPAETPGSEEIEVGDQVELQLRRGETIQGEVVRLEADSIMLRPQRVWEVPTKREDGGVIAILVDEVWGMRVARVSVAKTAALVVLSLPCVVMIYEGVRLSK